MHHLEKNISSVNVVSMITEIRYEPPTPESEFAAVTEWLCDAGDQVAAGDDIVEVEAEKSIIPLQAPVSGVLSEIVAVVGDELSPGALVGTIEAAS